MGAAKDPQDYTRVMKFMWDWWGDTIVHVTILAFILIGLVWVWNNTLGHIF